MNSYDSFLYLSRTGWKNPIGKFQVPKNAAMSKKNKKKGDKR